MLQIVQTDAEQPYLVRHMADNGEEIWRSSENYTGRIGARRSIELLAEEFGFTRDDWTLTDTALSGTSLLRLLDRDGKPFSLEVDLLDERGAGGER